MAEHERSICCAECYHRLIRETAHAILVAAQERDWPVTEVVSQLSMGWLVFDGSAVTSAEFVAVKPERVVPILNGSPMQESDILQRL